MRNDIVAKKTTELVLLFHKKTTKLVFLRPNMTQKSIKVLIKLCIRSSNGVYYCIMFNNKIKTNRKTCKCR